jgi:hypothetical protein
VQRLAEFGLLIVKRVGLNFSRSENFRNLCEGTAVVYHTGFEHARNFQAQRAAVQDQCIIEESMLPTRLSRGRLEIRIVYSEDDVSDHDERTSDDGRSKKRKADNLGRPACSPEDSASSNSSSLAREAAAIAVKLKSSEEMCRKLLAELDAERSKAAKLELHVQKLRGDVGTCKDLASVYERQLCIIVKELSVSKGSVKEFIASSAVYCKYLHLANSKASGASGAVAAGKGAVVVGNKASVSAAAGKNAAVGIAGKSTAVSRDGVGFVPARCVVPGKSAAGVGGVCRPPHDQQHARYALHASPCMDKIKPSGSCMGVVVKAEEI